MIYPSTLAIDKSADDNSIDDFFFVSSRFVIEVVSITKRINIILTGQIGYRLHEYIVLLSIINSATQEYEIHFYIDSPGGVLETTYSILSALSASPARVITHNLGLAASCGSLLLCAGDAIEVLPNTSTMFHNASGGAYGDVNINKQVTDFTIDTMAHIFDMFVEKKILSEDEVSEMLKGREYYFTKTQMDQRLETAGLLYKGV